MMLVLNRAAARPGPSHRPLFLLFTLTLPHAAGGQPARMSLEQIEQGLEARCADIHSLTIRCTAREEVINGTPPRPMQMLRPGEDPSAMLGDKQLGYPWMKVEYRVDGERRYVEYRTPQYGDFTGTSREVVSRKAWNGTLGLSFDETGRQGSVVTARPNHVLQNLVYDHLDIPVSTFSHARADRFWLPKSLQDQPSARVLPVLEEQDGAMCHVVEAPGLDRLWIDVDRGFALLRRERRRADGGLQQVTVARDWEEVGPGTWLPRTIVRDYYLPRKPGKLEDRVASTVTLNVEYQQAPLNEADFTFELPPDTLVIDTRKDALFKTIEPGQNPLDDAVAAAKADRHVEYRDPWTVGDLGPPLVALGCLGATFATALVVLRRRGPGA